MRFFRQDHLAHLDAEDIGDNRVSANDASGSLSDAEGRGNDSFETVAVLW